MKRKVVITPSSFGQVSSKPLEELKQYFDDIVINNTGKKIPSSDVVNFYDNTQYSIAGLEDLSSNILSHLPNLRVISRVGIGLDNIDLKYTSDNNIKVLNTPDPPTDAVSEMTITAALSLSRNLINYNKDLHMEHWNKSVSNSLKNRNVFIIGFGRICQKVGKYFSFFGSKVCYYDPYIESKNIDNIFKKIEFKEGLLQADIISIHSSSKSELLGDAEFKLMKDNVIILNSSRGYHINELALFQNLKSKKVSSCWIDVFREEPYKGDLITLDNAILTPHISTYTKICREEMEMQAVQNLLNEI